MTTPVIDSRTTIMTAATPVLEQLFFLVILYFMNYLNAEKINVRQYLIMVIILESCFSTNNIVSDLDPHLRTEKRNCALE